MALQHIRSGSNEWAKRAAANHTVTAASPLVEGGAALCATPRLALGQAIKVNRTGVFMPGLILPRRRGLREDAETYTAWVRIPGEQLRIVANPEASRWPRRRHLGVSSALAQNPRSGYRSFMIVQRLRASGEGVNEPCGLRAANAGRRRELGRASSNDGSHFR
jgi:hypothetical protein